MHGLQETAIEAIRCRYARSHNYGEFVGELERKCSPEEVRELLEWAEQVVPHPDAPRALRILKRAAKSAARGDAERVNRLLAAARERVGKNEVEALVEEHRLSFAIPPSAAPPPRPAYGFADVYS